MIGAPDEINTKPIEYFFLHFFRHINSHHVSQNAFWEHLKVLISENFLLRRQWGTPPTPSPAFWERETTLRDFIRLDYENANWIIPIIMRTKSRNIFLQLVRQGPHLFEWLRAPSSLNPSLLILDTYNNSPALVWNSFCSKGEQAHIFKNGLCI